MINWLFVNYLRGADNPPLPTQLTALALLSSVVADGDVITDWLYYKDIQTTSEDDIDEWLIILQLISCICGTFSWLCVATDGRLVTLVRSAVLYMASILVGVVLLLGTLYMPFVIGPLIIIAFLFACACNFDQDDTLEGDTSEDRGCDKWIIENILEPLWLKANQKPSFSTGAMLFFGIFVEDIPQLIVTFLIEDKIKSDHVEGQISNAALVNLFFAIFDIMHKLAQAYDLREDLQNPSFAVKRVIRAHGDEVKSLIFLDANQIISTSSYDKAVKVWDAATGKCKQVFKCESRVLNAMVSGTSKVLAACRDKNSIRIFDMVTGTLDYTLNLGFEPYFICISPYLERSFFTSAGSFLQSNLLQRWDVPTGSTTPQLIATYNCPGACSMSFLENDTFVCQNGSSSVYLCNIHENDPIHSVTNDTNVWSVLGISSTMFLINDGKRIKSFEFDNNDWIIHKIFKEEHNHWIRSLTKINTTLFVSTSDDATAKLWDIAQIEPSSIFTFRGHTTSVTSSMYWKGEQAIVTGDKYGTIKIWSIEKYLKDGEN